MERLKFLVMLTALVVFAGCSTKTTYYIELKLDGEDVSCSGIDIDFLSYNYYAVLDSLEKLNNPGPRPDSTELLAVIAAYQGALQQSTRISDEVNAMREALEGMNNKSIQYRKTYPKFMKLEKQLKQVSQQQQETHQKYLEARSVYESKLSDWKQSAYKGFSDFKESIPKERQTIVETTGSDCMVKNLDLPYGQWWLFTEVRRPGTTNELLRWSFEMPAGKTDSTAIILEESNAQIIKELL
ncbi:MAG: hypothetical protein U9N45_03595 [Gemmatimonadota bacterium]|nr:hypothetical protein [Gemmatimonadota bacterium]